MLHTRIARFDVMSTVTLFEKLFWNKTRADSPCPVITHAPRVFRLPSCAARCARAAWAWAREGLRGLAAFHQRHRAGGKSVLTQPHRVIIPDSWALFPHPCSALSVDDSSRRQQSSRGGRRQAAARYESPNLKFSTNYFSRDPYFMKL